MGLFTRSNTSSSGRRRRAAPLPASGRPCSTACRARALAGPSPAQRIASTHAAVVTTNAPQSERQVYLQQLKVRIHQQLVERLDMQNIKTPRPRPCAARSAS